MEKTERGQQRATKMVGKGRLKELALFSLVKRRLRQDKYYKLNSF